MKLNKFLFEFMMMFSLNSTPFQDIKNTNKIHSTKTNAQEMTINLLVIPNLFIKMTNSKFKKKKKKFKMKKNWT